MAMVWQEGSTVMLRGAKYLEAEGDRPFAAAQGDSVRRLRLMYVGRDKSGPYGYKARISEPYWRCVRGWGVAGPGSGVESAGGQGGLR